VIQAGFLFLDMQ